MSFRELRNFTEYMRTLGYPRLVSVENFRTPNFELVADCLFWMVKKYDPSIQLSDVIDSEDDRVQFITTVVQAMQTKARLKLNGKKLYAADGSAVKELLKVASVLYEAFKCNDNTQQGDPEEIEVNPLGSRFRDLKQAKQTATEITEAGSKLYDLLAQELELREARMRALKFLDAIAGNLDSSHEQRHIERCIRELIATANEQADRVEKQCQELEADENSILAKIKKKQQELERVEKRLKNLQSVRPAFMDEYEKLEKELERQYETYLERYRNLDYLEYELKLYEKSEKEKLKETDRSIKKMQKKLKDEELRILRGEQDVDDSFLDTPSDGNKASKGKGPADKDPQDDSEEDNGEDSSVEDAGRRNKGKKTGNQRGNLAAQDSEEEDDVSLAESGGEDASQISASAGEEGSEEEDNGGVDDEEDETNQSDNYF